jgi:hypothetical protein
MKRLLLALFTVLVTISTVPLVTASALQGTATPTQTPSITLTASQTFTPEAAMTLPPSWTPRPSATALPTFTRIPTSTMPGPATAIASETPIGGAPGVVLTTGLMTVEITEEAFNRALAEQKQLPYFASNLNDVPTVALENQTIQLKVIFGDFSKTGQAADFVMTLRPTDGEPILIRAQTLDGSLLGTPRVELARQLIKLTLADILTRSIHSIVPGMETFTLASAHILPDRIWYNVKITKGSLLTSTPGPSPTNSSTPSNTPSYTATLTQTATSTPSSTPTPAPTATLTATQTPQ